MASATNATMSPAMRCPKPFLPLADYPDYGGYLKGRFCGPVTPTITCCLPCPLPQWVSSNDFERKAAVAYWFNVPALVCQVFLLTTFVVLPKDVSGRHYLSVGLCLALMMLEISFIIPLGVQTDQCYNAITPKDMYSSMSCACSGALLEAGSMGAMVWILLRSLWTHLRVCWDLKHTKTYIWLAHILGWGLPALFLAISLAITGVSFHVDGTCIPNPHGAFVTWFGWLIAFGCLGALIQLGTTGFCLVVYARSLLRHERTQNSSLVSTASTDGIPPNSAGATPPQPPKEKKNLTKRLAWRRVNKVMLYQWRSIVLSLFVIVESIYFGTVYAAQVATQKEDSQPEHTKYIYEWSACLIETGGDKEKCMPLAKALSVPEATVIASFFMLIGILTFGLMVRWSMLVGWWELLRHPRLPHRRRRNDSADEFVSLKPKRISLGRILGSNKDPGGMTTEAGKAKGVLPSPEKEAVGGLPPEAGDVSRRHETTNLFERDDDGEGDGRVGRRAGEDNDDGIV